MTGKDDDKTALGGLGRQEILTLAIVIVLLTIPVTAGVTLYFAFTNPKLMEKMDISAEVDLGKFIDKTVESYDAFLVLLGVGVSSATSAATVAMMNRHRKPGSSAETPPGG